MLSVQYKWATCKEVLMILASYGLYINYKKCKFILEKIDFLGFEISENKIKPASDKQALFKNIGEIGDIKKLHSVVGLINYYRGFIRNYSTRTKCLYQMINKEVKFEKERVASVIHNIVKELQGSVYLEIPNMKSQFILETDASDSGIGGVLKQKYDDRERVVRYTSRTLKPAERNYATIEKEPLAIIYCVTKFKHYLVNEFIVRCDHKPLEYLRKMKDPKGKFARWILQLEQFIFKIEYIPGKKNGCADFLSRESLESLVIRKEELGEHKAEIIEAHTLCGHGCVNVTYL